MNTFLFIPEPLEAGLHLMRALAPVVPMVETEIFNNHQELKRRLRQPIQDEAVAVLLAPDLPTLKALQTMRDLLRFVSVILIVPSEDPEIMKQVHHLRPRYLASLGGDFRDAAAVLDKMRHREIPRLQPGTKPGTQLGAQPGAQPGAA